MMTAYSIGAAYKDGRAAGVKQAGIREIEIPTDTSPAHIRLLLRATSGVRIASNHELHPEVGHNHAL